MATIVLVHGIALDFFDVTPKGECDALILLEDDGSSTRATFDEMRARSNQVANMLRDLGIKRGDRILLMLGNEIPLWETMLAAIKLGAVLIPSSTLLHPDDIADRIERGEVRAIVADSPLHDRFPAGDLIRVSVGEDVEGWTPFSSASSATSAFEPDGPTKADDLLLLYFTSGTTSKPKLVAHTHTTYPVGHLTTMFVLGLMPGDVHLNISSPGWAKHSWSSFFGPWIADATILSYNFTRFDALALLKVLQRSLAVVCQPNSLLAIAGGASRATGPAGAAGPTYAAGIAAAGSVTAAHASLRRRQDRVAVQTVLHRSESPWVLVSRICRSINCCPWSVTALLVGSLG